jgi:hypothetical protein
MRVAVPCMLCGAKVYLNSRNCTLHVYTRQPAFSWCEMHCESCGNEALEGAAQEWFFHPEEWQKNLPSVISCQVSLETNEWVDQKTYEEYLDTWGKHLVVRELTDQDEKNIKFLAWLLDHYDTRFFDDPQRGEM